MEVWIVKMPLGSIEVFGSLRGAMKAVQESARSLGFPDPMVSRSRDEWVVEIGSREVLIYPASVRE